MSTIQKKKYCLNCEKETMFEKRKVKVAGEDIMMFKCAKCFPKVRE